MYAFIRGLLIQATASYAILDVSGVGYQISIPSSAAVKLSLGSTITLHTSFIVREGFQGLYGFPSQEERDLFNEVIEISGIGPKIALSLISHLSLPDLQEVILQKDATALSKIPGIGKKSAERLIIELSHKLEKFFISIPPINSNQKTYQDALKALINLGYNQNAAQKALKKTLQESEGMELAALVSTSLKHF